MPYRDAVSPWQSQRSASILPAYPRLSVNPNPLVDTGMENPLTHTRVPKSAEETRQLVKAWIAAGADYILTYDGALPMDYYQAAYDEANKAGKLSVRTSLRPCFVSEGCRPLGATNLPHSAGIGIAVTKDPSKFKQGRDDRNELDRYAEMDDAKARALIQVLVAHHVSLTPTFMINFPGYPKEWVDSPRTQRISSTIRNCLPIIRRVQCAPLCRVTRESTRENCASGRMTGFVNAMRFHKMFVDAGGHLVVSGNTNDAWVPGLDLHEEMEIMVDAGLTPMQVIQGSTKYPAEMLRKQDILGTIDPGKLADVIIVNADPLADIKNLDKINTVIQDGRVVELGYHANYTSPFANVASGTISIEGLPWAVELKKASRGGEGGPQRGAEEGAIPDPPTSPQPAIEKMSPIIVTQGDQSVVTITGFNFVRKSAVYFKGKAVPFRAVSATEIQVTLDAEALREAGRFDLVVKNPEPLDAFFVRSMWGNGTSNVAHLIVNYKY